MDVDVLCPNPSCGHVFALDALVDQTVPRCPKCGQNVLDSSPAKPKPAASPLPDWVADHMPAPPPPEPTPPKPAPIPSHVLTDETPADVEVIEPCTPAVRPVPRRRRRLPPGLISLIVVLVAVQIMVFGSYKLYRWYQDAKQTAREHPSGTDIDLGDFNGRFVIPPGWDDDPKARMGTKSTIMALQRQKPRAWFSLSARDYKTRIPTDDEMLKDVLGRLRGYFNTANFEYKLEPGGGPMIAGHRSQRLVFQGEIDNTGVTGEASIWTAKGIAYWLVVWAPQAEASHLQTNLAELSSRFFLGHARDAWHPWKPPALEIHDARGVYTLRDTTGLWENDPLPKALDPRAELLLNAKDPEATEDVSRMAHFMVLSLPPARDLATAAAAAKAYFEKREHTDNPGIPIEVLSAGKQPWEATTIGNAHGAVVCLHVAGDNRKRLIVLAVLPLKKRLLVLQGDAYWPERERWQKEFSRLLGTFHLQAG